MYEEVCFIGEAAVLREWKKASRQDDSEDKVKNGAIFRFLQHSLVLALLLKQSFYIL